MFQVVDLFCGAGGLSTGLQQAGFKIVAGVDLEPRVQFAFEHNHPGARFIHADITKISPTELDALWGPEGLRVLCACAPCQGFSLASASFRKKLVGPDERIYLLDFVSRLLSKVIKKPHIVVTENVPPIIKSEVWTRYKSTLKDLGYSVTERIVLASDYGTPQDRRRMVLIASLSTAIELPVKTVEKKQTVREAIGHLPELLAGGQDPLDRFHRAPGLSALQKERYKAATPGGFWWETPEHLWPQRFMGKNVRDYGHVYGRLDPDKPAKTILTGFTNPGNSRCGHYSQLRILSLREGAILQGFPEDFKFISDNTKLSLSTVARMIGNAVPVQVGKVIGESIKKTIGGGNWKIQTLASSIQKNTLQD